MCVSAYKIMFFDWISLGSFLNLVTVININILNKYHYFSNLNKYIVQKCNTQQYPFIGGEFHGIASIVLLYHQNRGNDFLSLFKQ
jgi:hypothetical protein